MILLLNGASSSGKTSLAKALQRMLPAPHLLLGIDTVVFSLPRRRPVAPLWHEVFTYSGAGDELVITAGPMGPIDVLVRRERERADRTIGRAGAHAATVHASMVYDVEVDTSTGDPDACAAIVAAAAA